MHNDLVRVAIHLPLEEMEEGGWETWLPEIQFFLAKIQFLFAKNIIWYLSITVNIASLSFILVWEELQMVENFGQVAIFEEV